MTYKPITERGVRTLDTRKAPEKGKAVPTIESDKRSDTSISNTGVTEQTTTKRDMDKGSGDPMQDSGLKKRGYSDEPRNPQRGRRINDHVKHTEYDG